MTKYFVKRNYSGTSSSAEMRNGYMLIWWNVEGKRVHLICRNAEGVHGKGKVGNPCSKMFHCQQSLVTFYWLRRTEDGSDMKLVFLCK